MAELVLSVLGSTFGFVAGTLKWATIVTISGAGLAAVTKPSMESLQPYAKQWQSQSNNPIVDKVRDYVAPNTYHFQDMIVCRLAEDAEHNHFIGAFGAWFRVK